VIFAIFLIDYQLIAFLYENNQRFFENVVTKLQSGNTNSMSGDAEGKRG